VDRSTLPPERRDRYFRACLTEQTCLFLPIVFLPFDLRYTALHSPYSASCCFHKESPFFKQPFAMQVADIGFVRPSRFLQRRWRFLVCKGTHSPAPPEALLPSLFEIPEFAISHRDFLLIFEFPFRLLPFRIFFDQSSSASYRIIHPLWWPDPLEVFQRRQRETPPSSLFS